MKFTGFRTLVIDNQSKDKEAVKDVRPIGEGQGAERESGGRLARGVKCDHRSLLLF